MSSVSASEVFSLGFLQLILAGAVLFAGVGTFVAYHDKDYKYAFEGNTSHRPAGTSSVGAYEALAPDQKRLVDRAVGGEVVYVEEEPALPPEVIKTGNDRYMAFSAFGVFDWLNPATSGPVLAMFGGFGLFAHAIWRDIKSKPF